MVDKEKSKSWAIYYQDEAYSVSGERIMGRQAAGNALLKGYARSNINNIGVYAKNKSSFQSFIKDFEKLLPSGLNKNISYIPWGSPDKLKEFGGLYYPAPDISSFSKQRYFYGHDTYSLIGITHTTASQNAVNSILDAYISPLREWDALICTSKSVKDSVLTMYEGYNDYYKHTFGADIKHNFELPVIPLGVHTEDYQFNTKDILESRKRLNIKENDIAILFIGRLSFHAKAHHIPMYLMLEKIKEQLPKNINIHLIQTGWFPNEKIKDIFVKEGKEMCPSVQLHFLDGRKKEDKRLSFAASDIFISLVDNFQETFGLTPLEGMAAGLPSIVSDWNGYKDTVRDNVDGFRLPTSTLNETDYSLSLRHELGIDNYDHFIGRLSQTVTIDITKLNGKSTYMNIKRVGIKSKTSLGLNPELFKTSGFIIIK